MNQIKVRSGFTIFLLFFGIALLQAFRSWNWVMIIFWLAMGLLFYWLDSRK